MQYTSHSGKMGTANIKSKTYLDNMHIKRTRINRSNLGSDLGAGRTEMNGRASKKGFLNMSLKYNHQKIQAMTTWSAKALTFIQVL